MWFICEKQYLFFILPWKDPRNRSHCPQRCCHRRYYWPRTQSHWKTPPQIPSQPHNTALEYWEKDIFIGILIILWPGNWNPSPLCFCSINCNKQIFTPAIGLKKSFLLNVRIYLARISWSRKLLNDKHRKSFLSLVSTPVVTSQCWK